jgi:hypothetical protein
MRSWRNVLGVGASDTLEAVQHKYKKLLLTTHPNKGGNDASFIELQSAWATAQAHYGRSTTPDSRRNNRATYSNGPIIKSLQNINHALRNGTLARSYNSIHNVNKSYFKTAFDAWASQSKISPRTAHALYDAIQVKSKIDFSNAVDDIVRTLGSQNFMTKRKKFAMIVDLDSMGGKTLFTPGSSLRFAGAVIRGLQRMPDVVVPVHDGINVSNGQFQRAMKEGIRNFVYVDDAAFTGEQKSHVVRKLQSMFVNYVTSEKFKSSFNLWLSIAFATPRASARIAKSVNLHREDTAILNELLNGNQRMNFKGLALRPYVVQVLGPVRLPAAARIELWHRLRKENRGSRPSMTILAHKLPNTWSFGVGLAKALESSMPPGAWAAANWRV